MAKKNNTKTDNSCSVIQFDSRTNAVMATASQSQNDIKEKVNAVREVIGPGKSNDEVILVLQYYDYNVEKTIQSYVEDGAKAALTEWRFSGNKAPAKKKKNRRKGAKPGVEEESPVLTPNGDISNHIAEDLTNGSISSGTSVEPKAADTSLHSVTMTTSNGISDPQEIESSPLSAAVGSSSPKDTHPHVTMATDSAISHPHAHHHSSHHRNRAGSHSGRHRTSSERSTGSEPKPHKFKLHAGLEKSTKDLHRQTVSLERLRMLMNEEMEKTYKRIKAVFEEMRTSLNKREVELTSAMDTVKAEANNTFASRQKMAADLKVLIDRSESMNEKDIAQLRADVKHFVGDRKIDEDLSRTTRFLYDSDFLKMEILRFGEVVPVNCKYTLRRQSVSSVGSGDHGNESIHEDSHDNDQVNGSSAVSTPSEGPEKCALTVAQAHEIADLQKRLKGSLQLQGLGEGDKPHINATNSTKEAPSQGRSLHSAPPHSRGRPENYRSYRGRSSGRGRGGGRGGYYDQDRRRYQNENQNYRYNSDSSQYPTVHIGKNAQQARGGGYPRGRGRGGPRGQGRGYQQHNSPQKDRRPQSAQASTSERPSPQAATASQSAGAQS